jgi:hypothetical protein
MDWLEVATPYRVYGHIENHVDEELSSQIWQAVGEVVLESAEATGPQSNAPATLAYTAMHLFALREASGVAARSALLKIAQSCSEPTVRSLARQFSGGGDASGSGPQVEGILRRRVRGRGLDVLRAVSGVALMSWLARSIGIEDHALRLSTRTHILGRTIAEREEVRAFSSVASVTRAARYRRVHLFVGLVFLSLGLVTGGLFAFDGIRTGETMLLLVAAVVLLGGAGLDLALDILVPAARGTVSLEIETKSGTTFSVTRVDATSADAFAKQLAQRFRQAAER